MQSEDTKLAVFERIIRRKKFGLSLANGSYWIKTNDEIKNLIDNETIVRFCMSQRLPDVRTPKFITKWVPFGSDPKADRKRGVWPALRRTGS